MKTAILIFLSLACWPMVLATAILWAMGGMPDDHDN
jgi:hypothetical protein